MMEKRRKDNSSVYTSASKCKCIEITMQVLKTIPFHTSVMEDVKLYERKVLEKTMTKCVDHTLSIRSV